MSAPTLSAVPTETYGIDPVHTTVSFAVKHFGVSTFRTSFKGIEGGLQDGVLRGSVPVEGIQVDDPNFRAHLLADDFFDVANTPTITFESTAIRLDGGKAEVEGVLTVKGNSVTVLATGTVDGPGADPFGGTRIGLDLEASVNRYELGLKWNADLPSGGKALGEDVKLIAHLELARQDA